MWHQLKSLLKNRQWNATKKNIIYCPIYQQLHARVIFIVGETFVSGWQQSSKLSRLIVRCAAAKKCPEPVHCANKGQKNSENSCFACSKMGPTRRMVRDAAVRPRIHQSAGAQVEWAPQVPAGRCAGCSWCSIWTAQGRESLIFILLRPSHAPKAPPPLWKTVFCCLLIAGVCRDRMQ